MNKLASLSALNAASVALALSDGTKVDFVKITSKDNIQVRLPDNHYFADGQENGRIFRRDGTHYKGETNLTLTATDTAAVSAAPAAAPISAANDDVTYIVEGTSFSDKNDAIAEATDIFRDTGNVVEIRAITSRVIGKVGFVDLAA